MIYDFSFVFPTNSGWNFSGLQPKEKKKGKRKKRFSLLSSKSQTNKVEIQKFSVWITLFTLISPSSSLCSSVRFASVNSNKAKNRAGSSLSLLSVMSFFFVSKRLAWNIMWVWLGFLSGRDLVWLLVGVWSLYALCFALLSIRA